MMIIVRRTGGYAGLTEELVNIDTNQMTPESAARVLALVESADLFNAPTSTDEPVGADLQQYQIDLTDGQRRHSIMFTEGSQEGERLQQLVDSLKSLS